VKNKSLGKATFVKSSPFKTIFDSLGGSVLFCTLFWRHDETEIIIP